MSGVRPVAADCAGTLELSAELLNAMPEAAKRVGEMAIHLSDEELGRVYRLKHGESQEEYKQRQQALEKQDWMLQMCYSTPRVTGIAPR